VGKAEIDEARPGDLGGRHLGGTDVEQRHDRVGEIARLPPKGLGERQCEIGTPVTERRIARSLEGRLEGIGRAKRPGDAGQLGAQRVRARHSLEPDPPFPPVPLEVDLDSLGFAAGAGFDPPDSLLELPDPLPELLPDDSVPDDPDAGFASPPRSPPAPSPDPLPLDDALPVPWARCWSFFPSFP